MTIRNHRDHVSTHVAALATNTKSAPSAAPAASEVAAVETIPVQQTVLWVNPPPADASIPLVPQGAQIVNPGDYRAQMPRNLELAAMPDVVAELGRFTEYASVFGKTAPPLTYVQQTFDAATQWSAMLVGMATWDEYARSQAGAAWSAVRDITASLSPAFELASKTDNTLARQFPALVRLFEARKVIAARAAATRKANKKAAADGKPQTHGTVGKRATRRAAKAALASAQASASTTAGGGAAAAATSTGTVATVSGVGSTTVEHAAVGAVALTGGPAGSTTDAAS
jgi:hypothetical protein